jgi:hypothetical protein
MVAVAEIEHDPLRTHKTIVLRRKLGKCACVLVRKTTLRTEFSYAAASHSECEPSPKLCFSKHAAITRSSSSASMTSEPVSARRKGSVASVAESFWCASTTLW